MQEPTTKYDAATWFKSGYNFRFGELNFRSMNGQVYQVFHDRYGSVCQVVYKKVDAYFYLTWTPQRLSKFSGLQHETFDNPIDAAETLVAYLNFTHGRM